MSIPKQQGRRKVRLTKKRLATLHAAITVDDVLYERFRRMKDELYRQEGRIYRAKQVVKVMQKQKNGVMVLLQIDSMEVTPDGTFVVVR